LEREHGVTINEIQIPTPYAHPHEWQANVLLATLLSGGAAALVLSAILVVTMLNTLFRQQIPQIGILKAVGARTGRIGGFYLAMTLLIAAAATAIALAPAVLLGRDRVGGLLAMIGVDAASAAVPWWTYAAIVAAGLGLPLLLALPPLVRASRITVRAAIDHHGGGTRPSRASALLARFRGLDSGLLMALRNTVRRPARFWLSVGLLASAGATFVAGMSLSSGTQALDRQRLAARYWDVEAELAAPAAPDAVLSALSGLPDVSRVEVRRTEPIGLAAAGQLPITRTYPDQGHGSITLTTVPENAPPPPELLAGRWLEPGERGAVVLGDATLDKTVPGLGPGDNVRLFVDGKATTWRIAGVVEESGGHGGGAFTTLAGFAGATGEPERVDELRLVTTGQDEGLRRRTAEAAAANLTGAGIEVALAASESRGAAASSGHLGPVLAVLLYIAVPMALIGGIGLAATMSANILDRFREFGVLHAIGARPRMVRRIVVAEGVFLALASCLVAALPALALTRLLGIGLGNLFTNAPLPYVVSGLGVAVWLVLVLLGAVLATEAAATRAARLTVREALAYL
jgi:putative ABC transport system permease protein